MFDELFSLIFLKKVNDCPVRNQRQILTAYDMDIVVVTMLPDQLKAFQNAFNLAVMTPLHIYRLLHEMNVFPVQDLRLDSAFPVHMEKKIHMLIR
ncbi:hypothetical protein D3C75_596720 [compost metagenome]